MDPWNVYLYVVVSDHSAIPAIPAMDPCATFTQKAFVIAENSN